MGVMRFLVEPSQSIDDWPEVHRAYISGLNGRVYPTRVEVSSNHITCRRPVSDSGKLHISWPVEGFGRPMLKTCSLPEREQPFHLAIELARGELSELRNQSAAWEQSGMRIPAAFRDLEQQAFRLFCKGVQQPTSYQAGRFAQDAIAKACAASSILLKSYTEQRLELRRAKQPHPPALLGCRADAGVSGDNADLFADLFDAAQVPLEWRSIESTEGEYDWELCDRLVEFCTEQRLVLRAGPLIDLSEGGMPEWLHMWKSDPLNLQSFICDFVETAVTRYHGRVRIWEVCSGGNIGGDLELTEEHRLALTARSLEAVQRQDSEAQLFVRIDQPWGGYQGSGDFRLSPYQFVDALHRSNVGLSGVNLEINIGYVPDGTECRDLMDFSQMLDRWSNLGLQIHVTLSFPSNTGADDQAGRTMQIDRTQWKLPWSEDAQARWASEVIPLLMAKQSVTGIYWHNFSDAEPHRCPHTGVLRADGTAKPVADSLRQIRALH